MKNLGVWLNKKIMRRAASAVLALVLLFGMLPSSLPKAQAASWMDEYIDTVVEWGVMRGDVSGSLNADQTVTRAEFVAMVNRAFGYSADTTHPFTDVTIKDWYNNDIGIAYNMGYFKGTSETTASPKSPLTREQAVVLIGRNLLLDEKLGETLGFSDSRTFSDWSRGMVESAISVGFIGGYEDGSFKPQNDVTRGEVAAMLVKAIGTMVNKPGTHNLGGVYGNVMISTSGVTLKNTTIAGNLYITGGLELGDVLLENVNVLGKIIVSGAGESHKGDSSVVLRNVEAGELVMDSLMDQFVTLRAEGNTQIDFTNVKTSAYLEDRTAVGDGLLYIEMNGESGMNVTLAGNIEEVLNRTGESVLTIAQGAAQIVTVDENAVGSIVDIKNIASVEKLNLDVGSDVVGEGDIEDIFINAAGSVVNMLPDDITIRPGLNATVNGEEMDTKDAEESSAEPRILAGYPKLKNLASGSTEVVFSANKKGTIYWALTNLINGPVGAEDLVETKDENTKILQQGALEVDAANKEIRLKISNLIADGSYYVSAVLVDSRGQHSPVKYITFTTPDGTAPEFADGYPELTLIAKDYAQVAVMPSKTSKLYYAVLPKGAAAPTIDEFKAGAISGDLSNCPKDGIEVTKNVITLQNITEEGRLEELKSYELYLCLIDPDNGRDSGVERISFTTVDGTAPILADALVTGIQKNAINLTTSMNEAGTIYWVAVKEGQEYPVPPAGTSGPLNLDDKAAILQVINGMGNIVSSGKVTAAAGRDVVLKVTKLEPESGYDIYYVAQDKAGNCSPVKKLTEKTLDTAAPTAAQEFTKTADEAGLNPLPETDVMLIFSESVRNKDSASTFFDLYQTAKDQKADEAQRREAMQTLVEELEASVQLWDVSVANSSYQVEHDPLASGLGTWINYEKVEMEMRDTGELVILFRSGSAISLGSGNTYQFILENVTDTSNTKNPMKPNPYRMDEFTTVFAQVDLTKGLTAVSGSPFKRTRSAAGDYEIAKDTDGNPIDARIDMSFRMDPQSTDSVNGNVAYDIWFEANQLIYFDLYCRVIAPEEETEIEYSMFEDCDDFANAAQNDGWLYLGNVKIGGSSSSLARASVNGLINGVNTTKVPKLNTLRGDYTYEFVLEVTGFGGETGYGSWSEEAMLTVVVPAGQNLSSADYTRPNPWSDEVKNLGNPGDFTVSRKFIDTQTPKFRDGYPTFNAGETRVDLNVMLDRPGTLHYVIAPLVATDTGGLTTSVATTVVDKDGNTIQFVDWFRKAAATEPGSPPANGDNLDPNDPLNLKNRGEKFEGYQLLAPTSDGIALMVENGASSAEIKTGKVEVGNTLQTIIIGDDSGEGLQPLTTYLVYCILTGESQEYSNVYCFQFTTEQVTVPTIELNRVNGAVWATTSTPAEMDWAVYANSMAVINFGQKMWTSSSANYIVDELETEFIDTYSDYETMTVLQALETSISQTDKRSVFDVYADETIKKQVLEFIQMETSSSFDPADTGDESFAVAFERKQITPQNLSSPTVYYFIAAARNERGETYGFKAVGGLRKADTTPPELTYDLTSVDTMAADVRTGPDYEYEIPYRTLKPEELVNLVYKGSVELHFSEGIALLISDSDTLVPVPEKIDTVEEFLKYTNTSGDIKLSNIQLNDGSIKFDFEHAAVGSTITIFNTGSISDEYGNVLGEGARLVLTFTIEATDMGFLEGFAEAKFVVKWVYG